MTPTVGARSASGSTRMSTQHLAALAQAFELGLGVDELALRGTTCFSTRMRVRRSRASATAISCSISPSFSRMVVRSACGNVGSIRAKQIALLRPPARCAAARRPAPSRGRR